MKNIHLIVTIAIFPENETQDKFGYSYQRRIEDYRKSLESVMKFSGFFNTLNIIECVSKKRIEFLHNYDHFNIHYSNQPNFFENKGLNEICHIKDFLDNSNYINGDDVIIKLTGRYIIENPNIFEYIKNQDIVAKLDGDIYPGDQGCHTFYFAITKKLFYDYYNTYCLDFNDRDYYRSYCVEWQLKEFMLKQNIQPLNYDIKLGVITCLYSRKNDAWTIQSA